MTSMLTDGEIVGMQAVLNRTLPGTATILRSIQTDDGQGGKTDAWGTIGTTACRLSPLSVRNPGAEEVHADAIQAISERWITLPAGTDVTTADRVVISGDTYDVTAITTPRSWELSRRVVGVKR